MLTQQQIFDKALAGIRAQGGPSHEDGTCKYRRGGRACGVGQLIPDNAYDPVIDVEADPTVTGLRNCPQFRAALAAGGVDLESNFNLLAELQMAHDAALVGSSSGPVRADEEFMPAFECRMRRLAYQFNLVYTPPAVA